MKKSKEFDKMKKHVEQIAIEKARSNMIHHVLQYQFHTNEEEILNTFSLDELREIKIAYDKALNKTEAYLAGGAYKPC